MKKFFVVVIALSMAMLCGCDLTDTSIDVPSDTTSAVESTEVATLTELYEDDNVKISFVEIFETPDIPGICYVRLKIENKSDKTVTAYLTDTYVNDTAQLMGTAVPIVLAPGKNSLQPYFFGYGNLGISSKDEIKKIEFKVWVTDDNNETVVKTENLVVEFEK